MVDPRLLRTQQVRSSFAHLPLTVSISALNSTLLGAVFFDVVARQIILVWVGIQLSISLARLTLWYVHYRLNSASNGDWRWSYLATLGAFLSGLAWGYAPLLARFNDSQLLLVTLVICGMCAGAATVHAAHAPAMRAFVVPTILPLAILFFLRHQPMFGAMTIVFGASMLVVSRGFRRWFCEVTSAQMELTQRTVELTERTQELDNVNRRLREEIANHRSTEEKLHQVQKLEALGRLTAGIAHDFNNLLMAIGGSAGQIGIMDIPAVEPRVRTIMQSVDRGATLTRQLLAFGRKQNLMPRSVDINALLREWEKLLLTTLGGYAQLVLLLSHSSVVAFVDATQLENAVLNLVINARDAMPIGGTITISTGRHYLWGYENGRDGLVGDFIVLTVADTGYGMSEEVRLRAFEPFFTTKRMQAGSGLGLSQVYGLVQQSGGAVRMESQVGEGTTVSIYLPQGRHDERTFHETTPAIPVGHHSGRLLLLDDDTQVREAVADMLRTAGFTVVAFDTPRMALEELRHRPADVLIVDFAIPEMRGDKVAEAARNIHPTMPILFITGYTEAAALREERWTLHKPFHAADLVEIVERAKAAASA
jgi:signal transduction histidine kinase